MAYPFVVSKFDHGSNLDVDTTAEQLTTTSIPCKVGILIRADHANTGDIYIGNSDVTAGTEGATDGMQLKAGDAVFLEISNANLIYVIGSAINQKVYFLTI